MGFLEATQQTGKQLGMSIMTVSALMVVLALYFAPADGAPIPEFVSFFVLGVGLIAMNAYYLWEAVRRHV